MCCPVIVGTKFYRAPEQEGTVTSSTSGYGVKADIYSLGIIIFEMFHPAFQTYMERAYALSHLSAKAVSERFPADFQKSENIKSMITWCLERDPSRRPTAEQILKSDLLPRQIEVEQRYLEGQHSFTQMSINVRFVFGQLIFLSLKSVLHRSTRASR